MQSITSSKLVDLIAEKGYTKKDSKILIEDIFSVIREQLTIGNKVKINEFGIFEPKVRSARNGFNPKTREPVAVPESKTIKFTASKLFKEDINL